MGRSRIEFKVWAGTVAALVVSVVVAVAEAVQDNPAVLEGLPWWARFLIIAALPPVIVFGTSYAAPHTRRPDLGED